LQTYIGDMTLIFQPTVNSIAALRRAPSRRPA
jgi:hypothetical protein